jgi:hypothetical protein
MSRLAVRREDWFIYACAIVVTVMVAAAIWYMLNRR